MNIKLERANFIDADELAQICKKSFDQEMILRKDGQPGGQKIMIIPSGTYTQ